MRVFDTVDSRIIRVDDSSGIAFPIEYEALEGFDAEFAAAVDDKDLVIVIRPRIRHAVRETVDELWRCLRILFSRIGDIGETPWQDMEITWKAQEAYEDKVPIAASEVIVHRHMRAAYGGEEYLIGDKEDMRKSVHDTICKLCELAALRLDFEDQLFARAFGQAVGSKFTVNDASLYGMYDIVYEIFREEFERVDDDKFWSLTSPMAAEAVKAAYDKIRYLELHRQEYEKEKARVEQKWGVWVKPA